MWLLATWPEEIFDSQIALLSLNGSFVASFGSWNIEFIYTWNRIFTFGFVLQNSWLV